MISLYLDELLTIEKIVEAANTLSVRRIPLRNIEGNNLYNLDEGEILEVDQRLKEGRIRVDVIDIDVSYDLYHVIDVEKIFLISKILGCRNVLIKMPDFTNFDAEKEQLLLVIRNLLNQFRRERINVSFHVNYEIDSAYLAFLIKEINNLTFSFNPGKCYENDKSITTYYRLLRRSIENVILYDVDKDKKPALLGYGKALVLDVIDKLILDKYRGQIYYDSNLITYVETKNAPKKGFFSRLFKSKKRISHQKMDEILRLDEHDEVELVALLSSQLQLLNRYKRS